MYTSIFPSLGLLYLASSLEEEGHTVEICDFLVEDKSDEKLKKLLNSADLVGFTVMGENFEEVDKLSKKIKKLKPDLPIIIGGPYCTFHPTKSLKDISSADVSVKGDGDYVIKDLTKAFEGSKKLVDIPGIYFRENGKIKQGKEPKIIKNLDSLPFPARHLVEKYEYGGVNNLYLLKPKLTSFISSRGCPFHCRFCTRHIFSYDIYRQRSAENVVSEIQKLEEKYRTVVIVDDNFLTDRKRVGQIMDQLIELGTNIDIAIWSARADLVNKALFKKMKRAGVNFIGFGIESGNQDVLDFYRKEITISQIKNAIKLSRKMNFLTSANFILGAPIETKQHIDRTINFACSLPLDIAVFYPLYYMYGSDMWNEAVEKGLVNIGDGYSVMADSNKGLGQITENELQEYCKEAFKKFYFRPGYIASQIYRSLIRRNFGLIKLGLYSMKSN
jgi:radical SAM superfamily enzyme YgiQ (UPF0313 family)